MDANELFRFGDMGMHLKSSLSRLVWVNFVLIHFVTVIQTYDPLQFLLFICSVRVRAASDIDLSLILTTL